MKKFSSIDEKLLQKTNQKDFRVEKLSRERW